MQKTLVNYFKCQCGNRKKWWEMKNQIFFLSTEKWLLNDPSTMENKAGKVYFQI